MKEFKGALAVLLSLILVFTMALGTYAAPEVDQSDPEFMYKLYITDFLHNDINITGKTQAELLDIKAAELGISDSRAFELELECGLHPVIYTKDERPLPETTVASEPAENTEVSENSEATLSTTQPLSVLLTAEFDAFGPALIMTATATGGTGNYQYKFEGDYDNSWLRYSSFSTEFQSNNSHKEYKELGYVSNYTIICTVTDGISTVTAKETIVIHPTEPPAPTEEITIATTATFEEPATTSVPETDPTEVVTEPSEIETEPVETTIQATEIISEPATESTSDATPETTDEEKTTYRYYFYKPAYWTANEYSDTAGIYWWEGADAPASWPGYEAHKADAEGVYYYDVPADVSCIIFNNFVDGGTDPEAEIYKMAYQTFNIGSEYYDAGECLAYPDGTENFDGMIFVVASDVSSVNDFSSKHTDEGMWYYYYGSGEYGITPEKNSDFYTTSFLKEFPASDVFDESIIPVLGDVNNDGKLNIKDATTIQKYVAKLWLFDKAEIFLADINEDATINIKDATHIQKKIANLI